MTFREKGRGRPEPRASPGTPFSKASRGREVSSLAAVKSLRKETVTRLSNFKRDVTGQRWLRPSSPPALAPPLVSPGASQRLQMPRGARKAFVIPCPVLGPQAYCDTGLGVPEHQDPNEKTVNLRERDREGRRARAGPLPTQSRPRDPSR